VQRVSDMIGCSATRDARSPAADASLQVAVHQVPVGNWTNKTSKDALDPNAVIRAMFGLIIIANTATTSSVSG
jgi:hypothetical protein